MGTFREHRHVVWDFGFQRLESSDEKSGRMDLMVGRTLSFLFTCLRMDRMSGLVFVGCSISI